MKKQKVESIKQEDLQAFMTYVVTGEVKDAEEGRKIKRLAKQQVNLADVTSVVNGLTRHYSQLITQLMEVVQVQDRVIRKVAPEGAFEAEQEEFEAEISRKREEMLKAQEELKQEKGDA